MSKHISMSINGLNHLHHHFCLFHGCPRHFHFPFHPAMFSLWPASACSSEIWMMAILSRAATSDNKQVWDFGHGQIDSSRYQYPIDQKNRNIVSERVSDVVYFCQCNSFLYCPVVKCRPCCCLCCCCCLQISSWNGHSFTASGLGFGLNAIKIKNLFQILHINLVL